MKLFNMSTIRLALALNLKYNILNKKNLKEWLEKLTNNIYSWNHFPTNCSSKKHLLELELEGNNDLKDHISKFNGVISQSNALDEMYK